MPSNSLPQLVAKYLLIDGQQRLITIFILLALIRDKAHEQGEEDLANEINQTLLVNPFKKGEDYFKLLPTQADRRSFQKIIGGETAASDGRILKAYQFFDRKYRQSNVNKELLKQIISTKLVIVSIALDPDDNPHLVFESLNAKGHPLTQADLIRNFFFMRVSPDHQEEIHQKYWKPMQEALGESLTEFVRHYLMKSGAPIKQNQIYFALKEETNPSTTLERLADLNKYSKYYQKLINPKNESDTQIRRAIERINRLESTITYPFLLNCYDDYENSRISSNDYAQILRIIENFLLRRYICNIPTYGLNKVFPSLYSQASLAGSDNLIQGVRLSLQSRGYPRDEEFYHNLTEGKLYGRGDRLIRAKLILESIEETYKHKEPVALDVLTVEHVMPQTLTSAWQERLGSDWELIHEIFLHNLGNLTLTGYNSELSNDSFESKKQRLSASHLELNKYFACVQSWGGEEIGKRAHQSADKCLSIWPYFGDRSILGAREHGVTGTSPKRLWILGQELSVQSWRDVLVLTMDVIAELEPEKFELIVDQFPRIVGKSRSRFRSVRELKNGAFVEVNLSAHDINRFCRQAVASIDFTADDWRIETV